MNYTKEQVTKFEKLGINSFSQLALLIPNSYEDLNLYNTLQQDKSQLIDATVNSVKNNPNSIQITFFVHNFNHTLTGVLFRPKPYMIHQYKVGSREFYFGKIECNGMGCSMAMPKKVTQIGSITPKYKCGMRSDAMGRFVSKYLTLENLLVEGIKESIALEVMKLHFPTQEVLQSKELSSEALYALKYIELFIYMKELSAKRRYFQPLKSIKKTYKKWLEILPFKLTAEQLQTIEDIKKDIAKDVSAKRMIVGDVGSGKTMVILATAYMNRYNTTILMAPTTILANQLFEEAQKFLPDMQSVLVTNKTKKIDLSAFNFIIGTHALLYRELPSATVVMVDEQHRFGTLQRNMLEKIVSDGEKKPHYFQFSATPIPRTQAMIDTAHIDVSLITSTPFIKDIDSNVIHKSNFKELLVRIKSEIAKDNQVLIVYPLVEQSEMIAYQSIEEARGYWEKNFEDVYVTHGKDKEKERVLLEFREKGKLLIATTVVEVGISLPRLTTVVIVGAERLGLSTLHQLRGRVSRTGLKGYCYLYTNQNSSDRLDKFVNTVSGFDIANLDLKFRKSGDLLKGTNQSGTQFKWVDIGEDEVVVGEVKEAF